MAKKGKAAQGETPKIGRPTIFNEEVSALICSLLAEGQSLRKICALENMPRMSTVMQWLFNPSTFRDSFMEQYRRARQMQAEIHADELIDIADDVSEDELFTEADEESGKSAKRVMNREFVQRSKIRIDTRMWIASRLLPKVYGAKPEEKVTPDDDSEGLRALTEAMASTQTSANNRQPAQ